MSSKQAQQLSISYSLSQQLWRAFFFAHYSCDQGLSQRRLLGAVCVIVAVLGFIGVYHSMLVATLLLATGLFGLLSKPLLVLISLHKARCHPFFNQQLTVTVSTEEILVRSGNSGYSQPWSNFNGYRQFDIGFAFYHDQHAFFFIPMSALSKEDTALLKQLIATAQLSQI